MVFNRSLPRVLRSMLTAPPPPSTSYALLAWCAAGAVSHPAESSQPQQVPLGPSSPPSCAAPGWRHGLQRLTEGRARGVGALPSRGGSEGGCGSREANTPCLQVEQTLRCAFTPEFPKGSDYGWNHLKFRPCLASPSVSHFPTPLFFFPLEHVLNKSFA